MLTPDFQKASGGFGNYKKFWDQWSSAIPANIEADAETLTVTYDDHLRPRGRRSQVDDVTLQLVEDGDGFLIAGEP